MSQHWHPSAYTDGHWHDTHWIGLVEATPPDVAGLQWTGGEQLHWTATDTTPRVEWTASTGSYLHWSAPG